MNLTCTKCDSDMEFKSDMFPTCPECLYVHDISNEFPEIWPNWCTTRGSERFLVVLCPSFKCPPWEGHLTDHPQPPVSYFLGSLSAASSEWLCSNFWTVLMACSAVMARVWLQLCLPLFLFTSTLCVDVSLIQGTFISFLFCRFKCNF